MGLVHVPFPNWFFGSHGYLQPTTEFQKLPALKNHHKPCKGTPACHRNPKETADLAITAALGGGEDPGESETTRTHLGSADEGDGHWFFKHFFKHVFLLQPVKLFLTKKEEDLGCGASMCWFLSRWA